MGLRKLRHDADIASAPRSARAAGLIYVSDASPGIRRRRAGRGFQYIAASGRTLRDSTHLDRIRRLAVPPAWTDVWICPDPNGHIQATGRDARGRKQYRYHARWRVVRDDTKFENMVAFGSALPALRQRLAADLATTRLTRQKVLAAVVQLLEKTRIRVGNEEYARANHSFGLTTLRDSHVNVTGSRMRFRFRGKSGKVHDVEFHDRRLASVVRQCRDLPGQRLFQFEDGDGKTCEVGSSDVNAYVREAMGQQFTAKDFRTWTGTVLMAHALQELPRFRSKTEAARNVKTAIAAVAGLLRNTPAVCRASYIHPRIAEGYQDGRLFRSALRSVGRSGNGSGNDLMKTEATVLRLLRRRARN